jgi:hypothetical protein
MIQRWPAYNLPMATLFDVIGLIEAHRNLQDRIEDVVGVVKERLNRWAEPNGYVIDVDAKDSEIYAWPTAWADKRKGPRVQLVIGGFCPMGFRRVEADFPYLWVYTGNLRGHFVRPAFQLTTTVSGGLGLPESLAMPMEAIRKRFPSAVTS